MRKNIAIIENHIISTNTVRQRLTLALIDAGYNVTVLSTGTEKELEIARLKGFTVIDIGTSNTKPGEVLQYMKKLRNALRQTQADVALTFTMRPAIWGNMVARRLKIPVITNITGIGPLAENKSIVYQVARLLYMFVLNKTARVFFQNNDDASLFLEKKFVRPEQVEIIPGSGVDYEYFSPRPKKRTDEKFVFLFISRLIADKGILEYVEAARRVKEQYDNKVEFQILGPYYSQNLKENTITQKQIVEWVEQGIVKYLGAVNDVRDDIADADCIVLPSYREGMSNVLLEAGSMEKPCITSNTTGCADIVIDKVTGLLCKPRSADDLTAKIIDMLHLPEAERIQMGKKAREVVKTKFAKQIVIDAYFKAIREITEK
ncbi:MAG: glycosyltransferase family 4 protein [Ferruginibacter sp.]